MFEKAKSWARRLKFGWFIATCFFSWLAYIVFLIVTQKSLDATAD